jgi:hypothetical protein
MSLDLSSYDAIQTNLFVKLVIPGYSTLTFSDYHRSITIDSVAYTGLGQLLSITDTNSSLRASPQEVTIAISGIPSQNITDILNNKLVGSDVRITRGIFDVNTGALISAITGNPVGKFVGVINNFDITDDINQDSDTGTITCTMTCTSVVEQLENKITGRRTNPIDQKTLYPTDECFDRVPALAKSNYNFGADR